MGGQGNKGIFLAVVVAWGGGGQVVLEVGTGFHAFIDMPGTSDVSSYNSDDDKF